MDSSMVSALFLVCIIFISTASPIVGCPYCGVPATPKPTPKPPSGSLPPVTLPPVPLPPVTLPPVPLPPVTLPPVPLPPVPVPPVPVPPVPVPPVTVPPLLPVPLPPVLPVPLPPVLPVPLPPVPIVNPPATPTPAPGAPCPPGTTGQPKCPINVLKLSACVDVLGGAVHAVIGHSIKTKCCPAVRGLADVDAAACLCTILRAKVLGIKVLLPIAIEVLLTCGKHPPPGFTCPF